MAWPVCSLPTADGVRSVIRAIRHPHDDTDAHSLSIPHGYCHIQTAPYSDAQRRLGARLVQ